MCAETGNSLAEERAACAAENGVRTFKAVANTAKTAVAHYGDIV